MPLVGPILWATLKEPVTPRTFRFRLCRIRLRKVRRQEGQCPLRSNLCAEDPAILWKYYMLLVEIEEAFKTLNVDLSLRPIHHQKDERIEAHTFVPFLAYSPQMKLLQRLKALAPGLTARSILQKFESIQMVYVHLPSTDRKNCCSVDIPSRTRICFCRCPDWT